MLKNELSLLDFSRENCQELLSKSDPAHGSGPYSYYFHPCQYSCQTISFQWEEIQNPFFLSFLSSFSSKLAPTFISVSFGLDACHDVAQTRFFQEHKREIVGRLVALLHRVFDPPFLVQF